MRIILLILNIIGLIWLITEEVKNRKEINKYIAVGAPIEETIKHLNEILRHFNLIMLFLEIYFLLNVVLWLISILMII